MYIGHTFPVLSFLWWLLCVIGQLSKVLQFYLYHFRNFVLDHFHKWFLKSGWFEAWTSICDQLLAPSQLFVPLISAGKLLILHENLSSFHWTSSNFHLSIRFSTIYWAYVHYLIDYHQIHSSYWKTYSPDGWSHLYRAAHALELASTPAGTYHRLKSYFSFRPFSLIFHLLLAKR